MLFLMFLILKITLKLTFIILGFEKIY